MTSGADRLRAALEANGVVATPSSSGATPNRLTQPVPGASSAGLRQRAAAKRIGSDAIRDISPCVVSGATQTLLGGDCRDLLGETPDNSVDLIFTDPGMGGSGDGWDRGVPGQPYWDEMARVLKPGGHLAFFASRKYQHRAITRAEDAGLDPRDLLLWVFGKGMPMSLDVGQAIDKKMGGKGEPYFRTAGSLPDEQRKALVKANPWYGWGTEIRPTWEPIAILRKPCDGSVANNVLTWGTGAMNIDATRIPVEGTRDAIATWIPPDQGDAHGLALTKYQQVVGQTTLGRWPADALFSHAEGCGESACAPGCAVRHLELEFEGTAKYFYCPKADRREKDLGLALKENSLKGVKPVEVCAWVMALLTPPGGLVLDPFAGTASSGLAAIRLDGMGIPCRWVGIELDSVWVDLGQRRLEAYRSRPVAPG